MTTTTMSGVRQTAAGVYLGVAAVAPFVFGLVLGLVIYPMNELSSSLDETFERIGSGPVPAVITAATLSAGIVLAALILAVRRVGAPGGWKRDQPYSVWRVFKWSLALYVVGYAASSIAPGLLTIQIGALVPSIYELDSSAVDAISGPWSVSAGCAALLALGITAIDVAGGVMERRKAPESVASSNTA